MTSKKFVLGIIPARYASSRFPGKPLALIQGVSMIQRVYKRCLKSEFLSDVCVATDDERIEEHVRQFGGNVIMTSANHQSGTDRCLEATVAYSTGRNKKFPDVVVNIQGDEPLVDPGLIDRLIMEFQNEDIQIATPACAFSDIDQVNNSNTVKLVTSVNGNALYFSRSPIPFFRNIHADPEKFLKHIGLYAYRFNILKEICTLQVSALEQAESLEQLRWLENGYHIRVVPCQAEGLCVDTPTDISVVENYMKLHSIQ